VVGPPLIIGPFPLAKVDRIISKATTRLNFQSNLRGVCGGLRFIEMSLSLINPYFITDTIVFPDGFRIGQPIA
jgi:hypothetical protein